MRSLTRQIVSPIMFIVSQSSNVSLESALDALALVGLYRGRACGRQNAD